MRARIPLAAAIMLAAIPAFAAAGLAAVHGSNPGAGGALTIPLGDLVSQSLSVLEPLVLSLVGAMLAWLMARLGPEVAQALHSAHVDRAIKQAIDAAFALVDGAARGKVLEVPVANEVIRRAAQYLVDHAPDVIKELGENLGPILIAQLSAAGALPANASAANLNLNPGADWKKRAAP